MGGEWYGSQRQADQGRGVVGASEACRSWEGSGRGLRGMWITGWEW